MIPPLSSLRPQPRDSSHPELEQVARLVALSVPTDLTLPLGGEIGVEKFVGGQDRTGDGGRLGLDQRRVTVVVSGEGRGRSDDRGWEGTGDGESARNGSRGCQREVARVSPD